MSAVTELAVIGSLLGSALVAGVFFAFSSFIMGALARLPAAEGIAAMQSINVVVLNRSFLGVFMGTAALSLVVAVLAALAWEAPSAPWYLAGALCYLALGTIRSVPAMVFIAVAGGVAEGLILDRNWRRARAEARGA